MNDPTTTDRRFFGALVAGDLPTIEQIVSDDFVIIAISGVAANKQEFLDSLAVGLLKFTAIEPESSSVRRYGSAAVVTGTTRMRGTFGEGAFSFHSRYTHVFVGGNDGWRMVSAQGTAIDGGVATA